MSLSSFIGENSKTIGVLPIDIIVGSKTSLAASFVINSIANYNALLGRDWIMLIGECRLFFTNFYYFGKVMK